jgi:hypothetical protein
MKDVANEETANEIPLHYDMAAERGPEEDK